MDLWVDLLCCCLHRLNKSFDLAVRRRELQTNRHLILYNGNIG